MEVSVQTSGPVAVAVLTGGLDSASAASMQDLLCQLIDHHERILIDFTDVHCVSSTGLRTLLVLGGPFGRPGRPVQRAAQHRLGHRIPGFLHGLGHHP